jgi:cyanophycinase-like exopeptidase
VAVVFGVDEHTAAAFDLDADPVTVLGRAALTVGRQGMSTAFASGATLAIDEPRTIAAVADRPVVRPACSRRPLAREEG